MKSTVAIFLFAALCCISILPGCKKVFDYLDDNPIADYTDCQIREIAFPKDVKGIVTYNKDGNPVSVKYNVTQTDRPNYQMNYDNKKRLVEIFDYYSQGNVEYWTRYYYNNQGLIALDTTYLAAGIYSNGHFELSDDGPVEIRVHKYTYDAAKRITKVLIQWPFDIYDDEEYVWTYDANGNRQSEEWGGPGVYDDKMNISRTHKVFMFLNRDYSRNNINPATAYNNKYLPTQFGVQAPSFLRTTLSNAVVTYKCK